MKNKRDEEKNQKYNRKDPLGVKKEDDGEIGVFEAEKYFNGEEMESPPRIADNDANKHLPQKDEQTVLVTSHWTVTKHYSLVVGDILDLLQCLIFCVSFGFYSGTLQCEHSMCWCQQVLIKTFSYL